MGKLARVTDRARVTLQATAGLALGGLWLWGSTYQAVLMFQLHRLMGTGNGTHWGNSSVIEQALAHSSRSLLWMDPLVIGGMIALPLGLLLRMAARARLRAGQSDPLDALRNPAGRHPVATKGILAIPALAFLAMAWIDMGHQALNGDIANIWRIGQMNGTYALVMAACAGVVALLSRGAYLTTRAGFRALVAPVVFEDVCATADDTRVGFDAVAITKETWAAVAAMAALPILTVFAITAGHLGDTGTQVALAAYVAVAVAGAVAFKRASRVSIGVDGVFVSGTSRARFFAYKDLDRVVARGSDLVLMRGGRSVLRLQLHGKDAALRADIAVRIQHAIDTAKARGTAAAGQIVASASHAELQRLADGAADYRAPAVTRQQLWSVIEGNEHDASTRTAAARALASTGDGEERARLRVAADRCAEPQLRDELMELGGADEEDAVLPARAGRAAQV